MMTEQKRCFKCGVVKNIDEFYRHSAMADGHLGKCKECTKKDSTERRNKKIEEVRAYDRKRTTLPHRTAMRDEWSKTPYGKIQSNEAKQRWAEKNPEKIKAHQSLDNAVRDRKVIKFPCQICGSEDSEGHHEDYTKPLEVIWLCPKHHSEHHKRKREEQRLGTQETRTEEN